MPNLQSRGFEATKMVSVTTAFGEKHTCQLCGYQTLKKTLLNVHEQAVHYGKEVQCSECEYQATKKSSLVRHQKSVHIQMSRV